MGKQRKISEAANYAPRSAMGSAMEYILRTRPNQFELKVDYSFEDQEFDLYHNAYFDFKLNYSFDKLDVRHSESSGFERCEPRFQVYGPKKRTDVQPGDTHIIVGYPELDMGLARRFSGLQFDKLQIIAMQLTSYKIYGGEREQSIAQELGKMTLEHLIRANPDLNTLEKTLSYDCIASDESYTHDNTYQIACIPQSTSHVHGLLSVAKAFHRSEKKMQSQLSDIECQLSEFDRQKKQAERRLLGDIGNTLGLPNKRLEWGCGGHLKSASPKDLRLHYMR